MVQILQELSWLQEFPDLNFIIIGALSLLIQGYLHYVVLWDIDLLFKNINQLKNFMDKPKTPSLKIFNIDNELVNNETISSLHTVWSFGKTWFNVDYILKKSIFQHYTKNTVLKQHQETMTIQNQLCSINLCLAHPWDVVIDKILSPRTGKELELKVDMSVDIRHIYSVYNKEQDNHVFWEYIMEKSSAIRKRKALKSRLKAILSIAQEIGYNDVAFSPLALKYLG
ncbi:MAG TPA: hypothetical protein VF399_10885 [bacterium]